MVNLDTLKLFNLKAFAEIRISAKAFFRGVSLCEHDEKEQGEEKK